MKSKQRNKKAPTTKPEDCTDLFVCEICSMSYATERGFRKHRHNHKLTQDTNKDNQNGVAIENVKKNKSKDTREKENSDGNETENIDIENAKVVVEGVSIVDVIYDSHYIDTLTHGEEGKDYFVVDVQ